MANSPQNPKLVTSENKSIPLDGAFEIGREDDCTLTLDDTQVSRRHCIIQADARGLWWITDLESTNGTYVNNRRITQATRLQNNDMITLGNKIYFHWKNY